MDRNRTAPKNREGQTADSQHLQQIGQSGMQIFKCKQHPAKDHEETGICVLEPGRKFFQNILQNEFFKKKQNSEIYSPH